MSVFKFKYFDVLQNDEVHKVGTDAMVLGALIEAENPTHILEIGTGTGVISLMLAQIFQNAHITSLDIDEKAVRLCEKNVCSSPFKDRISTSHQNFLTFSSDVRFDLIVSNPPYFNTTMLSDDTRKNLAKHEHSMSVKNLIIHADSLLTDAGVLGIILPSERTESLLQSELKLHLIKRIKVYGKPNKHVRDVLIFSKNKSENLCIDTFLIRDEKGNYSEEYKQKTKDFHYNELH